MTDDDAVLYEDKLLTGLSLVSPSIHPVIIHSGTTTTSNIHEHDGISLHASHFAGDDKI